MTGSGPGAWRRRGIGGENDERGWISFGIRDTHSLDGGQTYEILFVRNLALSGLGDLWVERLLGELDFPYRYNPIRVAYSFDYGWIEMPPLPSDPRRAPPGVAGRVHPTAPGGAGARIDDAAAVRAVGEQMAEAFSLRTAPVHADEIQLTPLGKVRLERLRIRTRFALRFTDLRDDQEGTLARASTVREAFNSPFRPFVLTTTSIGQEGLDTSPSSTRPRPLALRSAVPQTCRSSTFPGP